MGKALIIKGADFSQVAVDTIDIVVQQPVVAINLFGQVTITSPDGYDVHYTTDGSTPTTSSTKYTGAFNVQSGTTVKAVCYNGFNYSDVVTRLYDGTLQAPTISISDKGMVTLSATDDASIRYTTDGSDPTASSGTEYSAPFKVVNDTVIKAIAYLTSGQTTLSSTIASETASGLPEGPIFGKTFEKANNIPTGNLTDDSTRWVSPKIPLDPNGGNYTWYYVGATYQQEYAVEYNSSDAKVDFWTSQSGTADGNRSMPAAGKAYVRINGKIGQQYAGSKIVQGGVTLWEYDGSE